jgi:hypothetical protein
VKLGRAGPTFGRELPVRDASYRIELGPREAAVILDRLLQKVLALIARGNAARDAGLRIHHWGWYRKLLAQSEVLPAIECSGLLATDIEIQCLHYAETLTAWRERFWREDAERLYDARFCRLCKFYLAARLRGIEGGHRPPLKLAGE